MSINGPDLFKAHNQGEKHLKVSFDLQKKSNEACLERNKLHFPNLHIYDELNLTIREGDGTRLQYSCLENPVGRGAWWAEVHGVVKSWT